MNKKICAIFTIILTAMSLSACSNTCDKEADNNTQGGTRVTRKTKETPKIDYYKVGETVKVGNAEYTLKSVVSTGRREIETWEPKHVIKVTYFVKNDGKKDLPVGTDIDAYGPDNIKLRSYYLDGSNIDTIAPGKETEIIKGYGTKKLGTFELQFRPFGDYQGKSAKFQVNVK